MKAIGIGLMAAVAGLAVAFVGILAIFLFAIFGALVGAVTGWLVSIAPFLGNAVVSGFASIGVKDPDLVAIGAMLGFIAGFFKNHDWNKFKGCCD